MATQPFAVDAIFEDGGFRPVQPLPLSEHQRVIGTVKIGSPAVSDWPRDVAAIYRAIEQKDHHFSAPSGDATFKKG